MLIVFSTLFFLVSVQVNALELNFQKLFSVTVTSDDGLVFSQSVNKGESPVDIAFIDGRKVWVAQLRDGALLDTRGSGTVINRIKFPPISNKISYANHSGYAFGMNWAAAQDGLVTFFNEDWTRIVESKQLSRQFNFSSSRPFILSERAFYYLSDNTLISVDKSGRVYSMEETNRVLVDAGNANWSRDQAMKEKQADLIAHGHSLIWDGIFYPLSSQHLAKYFINMGLGSSPKNLSSSSPILGESLIGDIYVLSVGPHYYAYSQVGNEVAHFNLDSIFQQIPQTQNSSSRTIGPLFSVHPNGDLYAAYAIENDKVYFFVAKKNWGTDYFNLAKEGIQSEQVTKTRELIHSFNNPELRVLRNVFFAIQGYDFKSWDLKSYFNGYDWYQPKNSVKADVSTLTENQKRLFDLVVEEEARRKASN